MSESQLPEADDKAKGLKPAKPLPTERINFSKQLDLLRAYAAVSGPSGKTVTNREVADVVKMAEGTASMANSFFGDIGFLKKGDGGYLPAPEVANYLHAYEWNPESAAQKLAPLISASWFWQAVSPKLSFRPMEESEVISTLAEAASAPPKYKNQIRSLIDYMEAAGLISRDGTQIRARSGTQAAGLPIAASADRAPIAPEREAKGSVTSAFSQAPEGIVQFHISVKVDMGEFAGWRPDRIAAFFGGIAQVLAAKGAIEKDASQG